MCGLCSVDILIRRHSSVDILIRRHFSVDILEIRRIFFTANLVFFNFGYVLFNEIKFLIRFHFKALQNQIKILIYHF